MSPLWEKKLQELGEKRKAVTEASLFLTAQLNSKREEEEDRKSNSQTNSIHCKKTKGGK